MNFSQLSQKRYSVRSYKNDPIEPEKLNEILEAGRLAPTACNNQPQKIIVARSEEALRWIDEATPCRFGAPAVLIVCYDKAKCWSRSFDGEKSGEVDASIVTSHLMLQAEDLGIGSVWVMYFDPKAIIKNFSLDENIVPVALLPIGYPASDSAPSDRHGLRNPLESSVAFI
ncbi:MAG: nitroreductase family protein [Clostridiales bacterium]|nr:nitroreductase family protein [Clostridiales bacterium]